MLLLMQFKFNICHGINDDSYAVDPEYCFTYMLQGKTKQKTQIQNNMTEMLA